MTSSLTMGSTLYLLLCLAIALCLVDAKGHGSNKGCPKPKSDANTVTCLNGEGGIDCGKLICLADPRVECIDGHCVCPIKGDGIVLCGDEDEEVCYMISDPTLTAFSGEKVTAPISCKFPMTSVETCLIDMSGKEAKNAQCTIESFSWGVKGRGAHKSGKHFTGGFQVKITVLINNTYMYHNTIIHGGGYNGYYQFIEMGNKDPNGAGTYGKAIVTELGGDFGKIYTYYDNSSNIAEVRADCCGFRMGFRPPEFVATETSKLDPGVYVKVKSLIVKKYLGKDTGLCLAPTGVTFKDYVKKLRKESGKNVTRDVALLFRILKSGATQNFPNAPPQLQPLVEMAAECDTKPLVCAITDCAFIMASPKFLKCWSRLFKKNKDNSSNRGNSNHIIREDNKVDDWGLNAVMSRYRRDNSDEASEEDSDEDSSDEDSSDEDSSDEDSHEDSDEEEDDEESKKEMDKAFLLMYQCMQSYCGKSSILCDTVQNAINNTVCVNHIKPPSIMDFNCTVWDESDG